MREHSSVDAAEVFAVIGDPRYNALRLRLTPDPAYGVRFNLDGNEESASPRDSEHADVVRRTQRT
jgi:hypothetical protein